MSDFLTGLTHHLIGCDWGPDVICTEADARACPRQATGRYVLHQGGTAIAVQLCDAHSAIVEANTTPHSDPTMN